MNKYHLIPNVLNFTVRSITYIFLYGRDPKFDESANKMILNATKEFKVNSG